MKKLLFIAAILTFHLHAFGQSKSNAAQEQQLLSYLQKQDYAAASKYVDSVYQENTNDPVQLAQLAYAHLMAGKLLKSEAQYLRIQQQHPNNLAAIQGLAGISLKRGNIKKAKDYYREAIRVDSTNALSYKQLASLSSKGPQDVYLAYLKKANSLDPGDAEVAVGLGNLYVQKEEYSQADAVLTPAIRADSSNLRLLELKMPVHIAAKKYEDAVATGEHLLAQGDSSTMVLNELGKTYFLLLQYQKALNCFLKIDKKEMSEETLAYQVAQSYRGLRDYKSAIPYLENSIREGISSKTASYYGVLGDSFERINKNQEANAAYKEGLKFENNGSLYYNIALVYENKLNDKKNAIEYYTLYQKTLDQNKQAKTIKFIKSKIEELKR